MIIKILGSGCPNCRKLEENAKAAVAESQLADVTIEHVTDINDIAEYGIMTTPGLVIGDEVKTSGRIPDVVEIKSWILP
jgi:small redox-active disulfide protein 2